MLRSFKNKATLLNYAWLLTLIWFLSDTTVASLEERDLVSDTWAPMMGTSWMDKVQSQVSGDSKNPTQKGGASAGLGEVGQVKMVNELATDQPSTANSTEQRAEPVVLRPDGTAIGATSTHPFTASACTD